MNRERLTKLYEFFKTVPKDQVDLSVWECGTQACLAGWACRMPEFQALGLRYEDDAIWFGHETSYEALAAFFDLDVDDALNLFSPAYGMKTEIHKSIALGRLIRQLSLESS